MKIDLTKSCRAIAVAFAVGWLLVFRSMPSFAAQSDGELAIHFERFGQPSRIGGVAAFELKIYEDGSVMYTGHARVRVAGPVREVFERSAVEKWRGGLVGAGFMAIKNKEKLVPPADGTWHRVTVNTAAMENTVTFEDHAPLSIRQALKEMLKDIDPYRKWVCMDPAKPEC
jgi:hypothetical protein